MSGKRYTEEFKIEAVKQIIDRGYKLIEVADRLGVTSKSLGDRVKKYGDAGSHPFRSRGSIYLFGLA